MTYQTDRRDQKLEMLEVIPSGSPAVNQYYTLTAQDDNYSASYSGSGTTTLTLPAGHYFARCTISITRAAASQNIQFELELDGVSGDRIGVTGWHNDLKSDYAAHAFTLTTSGALRVKVLNFENSAPTVTSNSRLWIWRTT
jgi:hypothetical protein